MNNYVFAMVMREPKRIRPLLEYILGKKIRTIRLLEREKVLQEKYESKSVRLDLYVEDEDGVVYDIEVQTTDKKNLGKRMRYYQGLMDISLFPKGTDYRKLKKSYVIFICNFDHYDQGRPIYSFQHWCDQDKRLLMGDQAKKIVVNTKGYKDKSLSPELREVLHYLDDGTVTGKYTQELDDAVQELINNEERGQEYMMMATYMAEQKSQGKYENLVELVRGWNKRHSKIAAKDMAESIMVTLPTFNSVLSIIKGKRLIYSVM